MKIECFVRCISFAFPVVNLTRVSGIRIPIDEEDEEVGSGPYHGEEEVKGDDDHENDSDDGHGNKPKENSTPLWKYVTRLGGGKGGGTTKFICPHCRKTYMGSYTSVRKYLCGVMPCDENKTIGVKTYGKVPSKDRTKYKREEEEAQHKSKNSRIKHETSSSHRTFSGRSPSTHGSGFSAMHSGRRTI